MFHLLYQKSKNLFRAPNVSLLALKKNVFTKLSSDCILLEQTCNIVCPFSPLSQSRTKSSGHGVETFHCFYRPLSRRKGYSTRWLSFRLAREILTHDGPGCGVCEDDVGRRLASSPEALLRQEATGHIIPVARKVPLMPLAPSGLISPEPLSLSTSIRVAGLPRGNC